MPWPAAAPAQARLSAALGAFRPIRSGTAFGLIVMHAAVLVAPISGTAFFLDGTHSLTAKSPLFQAGSCERTATTILVLQRFPRLAPCKTVPRPITSTITTLSSSLNPAIVGDSVTFTVVVSSGSVVPGGSVRFLDGTTALGTVTLASGSASFSTSNLSAGTHSITAAYMGDRAYAPSSATISQPVVHAVSLSWNSSSSPNIVGYNVYRGAASGGPYAMINLTPVANLAYTDMAVTSGQTYYYVCTAVDSGSNESANSNEGVATVP